MPESLALAQNRCLARLAAALGKERTPIIREEVPVGVLTVEGYSSQPCLESYAAYF